MKKILDIIYRVTLSLFEFIIDALIIFLSVILLNGFFGDNICTNTLILLIVLCGLVYAIHNFIEVYNENKLNK